MGRRGRARLRTGAVLERGPAPHRDRDDRRRATAWGDLTTRVGRATWLESGLRVTRLAAGRVYAEPRVGLRREGETARAGAYSWRVAAGGYQQFVNQFDLATTMPVALVPSLRFWLPADGTRGVPTSWHLVTEGVWRPTPDWEVRAEVYGKWQPVLLTFDYGTLFGGTAPMTSETFVQRARGHAAGAGARVERRVALFARPSRLGVSYDGGIAQRTFPSRFGGTRQPTPWLEPHRAQASFEIDATSALVVALRARGVWGRRWALRQGFYDLLGPSTAGAGLPLSDPGRMGRPSIIEADLGARWTRALAGAQAELGLSAQNLFDRRNVMDYGLRREQESGRYVMVPRYLPGRQIAVTLRIAP